MPAPSTNRNARPRASAPDNRTGGGVGSGSVDPRGLSGLELWLDARYPNGIGLGAADPADGDPLGQWNDLSGNDRHAVQATTSKKPLWRNQGRNLLPYPIATADDAAQFTTTGATALRQTAQALHGSSAISLQPVNQLANPSFETDTSGWSTLDLALGGIARKTSPVTRTNLITDPSFDTTSGQVAARTNMVTNPALVVNPFGWATGRWFGGGSGAGTYTHSTTGGPFAGTGYRRKAWTVAPPQNGDTGFEIHLNDLAGVAGSYPVVPGKTYTISAYMRSSVSGTQMCGRFQWYDAGGVLLNNPYGAFVTSVANVWQRVSFTAVAPANTAVVVPIADVGSGGPTWAAGDTVDASAALLEESDVLLPYFDGTRVVPTRRNLHSSPSMESALQDVGYYFGVGGAATQTRSTATAGWIGNAFHRMTFTGTPTGVNAGPYHFIPPTNGLIVPGRTYTASAYIRSSRATRMGASMEWKDVLGGVVSTTGGASGQTAANAWTRFSATSVAPAGAYQLVVTFYSYTGTGFDGFQAGDTVDQDGILVEESATLGAYFDGSTAPVTGPPALSYTWEGAANGTISAEYSTDFTYAWTGTAHQSASQQRAPALSDALWFNYGVGGNPTVQRTTELSLFGSGALKAIWSTNSGNQQYAGVRVPLVVGQTYVLSLYVYVPSGSPDVKLGVENTTFVGFWINGTPNGNPAGGTSLKDQWVRLAVAFTATITNPNFYLAMPVSAVTKGDDVCYVDGAMVEFGPTPTAYFSGGTPNATDVAYAWTGTASASTSVETVIAKHGSAVLEMDSSGAYTRQAVTPGTPYTGSAYVFPPAAGVYGVYPVSAPTPTNDAGPGRRYAKAKNGPGVYVEEFTTNLVTNPSMEVDLAGWGENSSQTVARDTVYAVIGSACLRATHTTGGTLHVRYNGGLPKTFTVKPNTSYAVSAYLRGYNAPAGATFYARQRFYDGTGVQVGEGTVTPLTVDNNKWQRSVSTGTSPASAIYTEIWITCSTPGAGQGFLIDAVQVEEKAYATSYTDGTLGAGYSWDTTTNILSAAAASFEDGSTGGWNGSTNWSIANGAGGTFGTKALIGTRLTTTVGSGYAQCAFTACAANTVYTASVWVNPSVAGNFQFYLKDQAGNVIVFKSMTLNTGWQRIALTGTTLAGSTGISLYVTDDSNSAPTVGTTCAIDGVQIEARSYATPFGGGGANATTSSRLGGSNAYVGSINVNPSSVTLACTFKAGEITSGAIGFLAQIGNVNSNHLSLRRGSGHIDYEVNYGVGITSSVAGTAIVPGDLVSMAVVVTGLTCVLYMSINGGAVTTKTNSISQAGSPTMDRVSIGCHLAQQTLQTNSPIENVMVFNAPLSDADARTLVLGTTLPSAAANRTDCVWSAFVNDGTYVAGSLPAGQWSRISHAKTLDKNTTQADLIVLGPANGVSTPTYLDAVQLEIAPAASVFTAPGGNLRADTVGFTPVTAGVLHTAVVSLKAATTLRSTWMNLNFYNASNGYISGATITPINDSTAGWTQVAGTFTPPAGAVSANLQVVISGVASREVHYADQFGIWQGSSTLWVPPAITPNGQPMIQFDGVDDIYTAALPSSIFSGGSSWSVYTVFGPDLYGVGYPRVWSFENAGGGTRTGIDTYLRSDALAVERFSNGAMVSSKVVTPPALGTAAIWSTRFDAGMIGNWVNGIGSAGSNPGTVDGSLLGGVTFSVNGNGGNGSNAYNRFSAVLVFSGTHDDATRKKVERWLGATYGIGVS